MLIFISLPNEILLYIFKYLFAKDIIICSETCKYLHKLLKDDSLWKDLVINKYGMINNHRRNWIELYKEYSVMKPYICGVNERNNLVDMKMQIKQFASDCHTVLIDFYNNIWVSGSNTYGQLGLGDFNDRFEQCLIENIKGKRVSVGINYTIIIDINDNVWSFGLNNKGQLGLGDLKNRNRPTQIMSSVKFHNEIYKNQNIKAKQISTGKTHTLLIDLNDNVWSFGCNHWGQLGVGVRFSNKVTPTQIANIKAKQISAGENHSILIDLDNNVWSFGKNDNGQLGLGVDNGHGPLCACNMINRYKPVKILNIKAKQVSAGFYHTILIDLDHNVWSFGSNIFGQLGNNLWRCHIPKKIPNIKAKECSSGGFHSILIDLDNNVWSFGSNTHGQLGLGNDLNTSIPTRIPYFKAYRVFTNSCQTILIGSYSNYFDLRRVIYKYNLL
jgi:alpha-tubulin suppressor-like RCC1 family protein